MTRSAALGDDVIDHFPAFESDGYTKRPGLSGADFTVSVYQDGALSAVPVTITEIGTSGEYKIEFEPTATGFWQVQVLIDFNKEVWASSIEVGSGLAAIQQQVDKIDLYPTLGPGAVTSGSLMDRIMNKDSDKTYNQGTDSLEAIRDRTG